MPTKKMVVLLFGTLALSMIFMGCGISEEDFKKSISEQARTQESRDYFRRTMENYRWNQERCQQQETDARQNADLREASCLSQCVGTQDVSACGKKCRDQHLKALENVQNNHSKCVESAEKWWKKQLNWRTQLLCKTDASSSTDDADGDGIKNWFEVLMGSNPCSKCSYGGKEGQGVCDAERDYDLDGVPNGQDPNPYCNSNPTGYGSDCV